LCWYSSHVIHFQSGLSESKRSSVRPFLRAIQFLPPTHCAGVGTASEGCVLLLDAADVFLMQRTWKELKREALVSGRE
jgi:hypothetical protein